MAAKDVSRLWRLFKTPRSNASPTELSVHFAAFRALMEPRQCRLPPDMRPQVHAPLTLMVLLNEDITIEELCSCIKQLKHGKSPGIDGILIHMIKDGGGNVQQSLLWLFSCMHAGHFPERL